MNTWSELKRLIIETWTTEVFGSQMGTLLTSVFIIIFFLLLRGLLTNALLNRMRRIAQFSHISSSDQLFIALEKPTSLIPLTMGLFISTLYLDIKGEFGDFFYNIEKSLFVLILFWSLHNIVDPLSHTLQRLEKVFSKPMISWLKKGLKLLFVLLGGATVLEIWGIKVAPIIAGLGLLGVAVALGAQDMFKNLIAGLTVIAEKRFHPGDWIKIEGVVEGVVEEIGFRSTFIRRFDKAPVHVPNAKLADHAVTNFSAMTHRRIYWTIGLRYDSTIDQLKTIREKIESYILNNNDFAHPPEVSTFVRISTFSDSSIDIMIYCFTKSTKWGDWLKIREDLACTIKEIVEEAGSGFAFPSQSIYIESNPEDYPEAFVPPNS